MVEEIKIRRGIKRRRIIPARVGDLVRVEFPKLSTISDISCGRIIKIEKRYGLINNGTWQQTPLVTVIIPGSDEEDSFDASYITAVLERAKKPARPRNVFAEWLEAEPWLRKGVSTSKKGVLYGPLPELAVIFLAQLPIVLERPLDKEELERLFRKQMPGVVNPFEFGCCGVNAKAFGKWVKRNALKICKTTAQMCVEETRIERGFEDEYWDFVEQEELNGDNDSPLDEPLDDFSE